MNKSNIQKLIVYMNYMNYMNCDIFNINNFVHHNIFFDSIFF